MTQLIKPVHLIYIVWNGFAFKQHKSMTKSGWLGHLFCCSRLYATSARHSKNRCTLKKIWIPFKNQNEAVFPWQRAGKEWHALSKWKSTGFRLVQDTLTGRRAMWGNRSMQTYSPQSQVLLKRLTLDFILNYNMPEVHAHGLCLKWLWQKQDGKEVYQGFIRPKNKTKSIVFAEVKIIT